MDSILCDPKTNGELLLSKFAFDKKEGESRVIPIEPLGGENVHKHYQKTLLPPFPTALHHFSLTGRSQHESDCNIHYTHGCDQTTLLKLQSHSSDSTASTSCEIWNRLEEMGRSRAVGGKFNRLEEIGRSRVVAGKYLEALHLYEEALQEKIQNFGTHHRDLIPTLIHSSRVLELLNLNNEACASMKKAVDILRHNIKSSDRNSNDEKNSTIEDDSFLAKIHVHLGKMYQEQGNHIAAMKNFHDALNIQVECRQGRTHEEVGYVLFLIAHLHKRKRQYSEAKKCYLESLQVYKGLGTDKNNSIVRALERAINNNNKIMSWNLVKDHWGDCVIAT